jgi:hypothetical protein
MRALPCCMPCRAGGQFALLDQNNVRPPFERQMVKETYAHYPTTDDNHSGMRFHVFTLKKN